MSKTVISIFEKLPANFLRSISEENFEETSLGVFNFQYHHNLIYKKYCDLIKKSPHNVSSLNEIPFIPISFFKTHEVKTTDFGPEIIFESSGTTGSINSRHFVKHKWIYEESFNNCFNLFYEEENISCVLGLLPSYLERQGSSLVYMVDHLIKKSGNLDSGMYLYDVEKLKNILLLNEKNKVKTLLIGVTYALIDFAEKYRLNLSNTIIMETGGMKGRKQELSRNEVHYILKENLGVRNIHSEYGMTELLSQAYSYKDGIFSCPSWMKIMLRDMDDPLKTTDSSQIKSSQIGIVNIIDLANIYSCSFIATDDAAVLKSDGSFEITGRVQDSDIRGCGLMIL